MTESENNLSREDKLREKLLKEIGPIFSQYVMDGKVNTAPFSKEIDLNIDDLDTVLKVHFLLPLKEDGEGKERLDVLDFMDNLKERIREIKTTIRKEKERFQGGEIRGKIDFSGTLKERLTNNMYDETVFICNLIDKNYNTDENQVLKAFLLTLQSILKSDKIKKILENEKNEYIYDVWKRKRNINGVKTTYVNILDRILENNIYLRKIGVDKEDILKDERKIHRVAKSRNNLYSEAAKLLIRYKRIIINRDVGEEEARELLRNTFIKPERIDVLFELYWALSIVKEYKKQTDAELKPIGDISGDNILAEWEKEGSNFEIYYRSSGGLDFSFKEDHEDIIKKLGKSSLEVNDRHITESFIGRELKIMGHFNEMGDQIKLWFGNEPDIILKETKKGNNEEVKKIFIGEVKNTENKDYAKQGLKELLEYISLVGMKGEYFEKRENLFKDLKKVNGALFLRKNTQVGKITDTASEDIEIIHFDDEKEWDSLKEIFDLG